MSMHMYIIGWIIFGTGITLGLYLLFSRVEVDSMEWYVGLLKSTGEAKVTDRRPTKNGPFAHGFGPFDEREARKWAATYNKSWEDLCSH